MIPKFVIPPVRIYAVLAVILIASGLIGLWTLKSRVAPAVPLPTPTPIVATPAPLRPLSNIATQSAFLQFASAVASLSAAISSGNIQDQTLAPPILTLPLGF